MTKVSFTNFNEIVDIFKDFNVLGQKKKWMVRSQGYLGANQVIKRIKKSDTSFLTSSSTHLVFSPSFILIPNSHTQSTIYDTN